MSEEKKEIVPYNKDDKYSKSNWLIGAKYKSGLIENKIMAIALDKVQKNEFRDEGEEGGLICQIKASELRKLLDANSGSFYSQLEPVAQSMASRTIGMTDPEKREFEYISVINKAKYKDGIFTIKFNSDLKKYITNLQHNFTILELPIMLKFKSVYSFRLYELLKSKAYYPKGEEREDNVFMISFDLNELKLDMGVVNAELDAVKKVLNNTKNPDYARAVEKSPEKTFKTWYDFRRKVLDVATKEICEKTDMQVSYEAKKGGRGAKVYGIDFTVITNAKSIQQQAVQKPIKKKTIDLTEEQKDEFIDNLSDYIEEPLKVKDLRSIADASSYDMEIIKKSYEMLKNSNSDVDNVVGWLVAAIQRGWADNKAVARKASPKKTSFNNFDKREYDDEELEIMQYFIQGTPVLDKPHTRKVMDKMKKQGMIFTIDDGFIYAEMPEE